MFAYLTVLILCFEHQPSVTAGSFVVLELKEQRNNTNCNVLSLTSVI